MPETGGVRAVDDSRFHVHLHGVKHVAAGEVDARRNTEVKRQARAVRCDQRAHDVRDAAAREVVRLELAWSAG